MVAPHAGAWIETYIAREVVGIHVSRPTRARGLKHQELIILINLPQSRPTRARGLKLIFAPNSKTYY